MRFERDGNEEEVLGFGGVAIHDDGSQTWLDTDDYTSLTNTNRGLSQ